MACLNLFLAGIFALVLPFICWGAEATPGHPHARAHFVFLPPPHNTATAQPAATDAHALLRATADDLARGVHELCATAFKGAESAAMPTTQSTPLLLAITLLLLAAMRWLATLLPHDGAGFCLRMAAFLPHFLSFDVATPPPRLQVSIN